MALFTQSIHKVGMVVIFSLIPLLAFAPGINIGTDKDIKNINFSMGFFVVACLGIGAVATGVGFGNLITQTLSPILAAAGNTFTLVAIWLFGVIANFLLTPIAILAAFSAPVTQIAIDLGINPLGALYVLMNTLDQIVLPYEYVNYLIFFSFGVMSMKDFAKIMGVKMIIGVIFLKTILFGWWNIIGVL